MEIVTYVLAGALEHKDSLGTGVGDLAGRCAADVGGHGGDAQRVQPLAQRAGALPADLDLAGAARGGAGLRAAALRAGDADRRTLRLIAAPDGRDGAVTVHQDVALYASLLAPGRTVTHSFAAGRQGWLQVARGTLTIGEATMQAGDGAAIQQAETITIAAAGAGPAEFLLFDLA
jgi:redox-sensitive bicupin YhaK (pirin superfamily)